VLLGAGGSPAYVRTVVRDNIKLGAQAAKRDWGDIDVAAYILMSPPGAKDEKILKSFLAFELAYSNPEYVKAANVDESQAGRIREALESKGLDEAVRFVSDDVVDALSACGEPEKLREKIQEHIESGVKHPVICPTTMKSESVKRMIDVTSGFLSEMTAHG
jgi:alkanesulfonate monooxygenase SsuD/methylene tetrahydromethanopterin reductase-like flavin-dependent oxidoreductase (luciferase family)